MDYNKLINLRNTVENLDAIYHLEILQILKDNNVNYTENRNGIFINLTLLNQKTISIIKKYISFIEQQKKNLDTTEQIKNKYKSQFFIKDNKDKMHNKYNASN